MNPKKMNPLQRIEELEKKVAALQPAALAAAVQTPGLNLGKLQLADIASKAAAAAKEQSNEQPTEPSVPKGV